MKVGFPGGKPFQNRPLIKPAKACDRRYTRDKREKRDKRDRRRVSRDVHCTSAITAVRESRNSPSSALRRIHFAYHSAALRYIGNSRDNAMRCLPRTMLRYCGAVARQVARRHLFPIQGERQDRGTDNRWSSLRVVIQTPPVCSVVEFVEFVYWVLLFVLLNNKNNKINKNNRYTHTTLLYLTAP